MKHFKLFFALFAMLALGVGNAWADDVTFSWAGSATADGGKTDYVVEQAPVTLTFAVGTASNAPRTNKEGSVRMYANTTLTISCASGNITKVTFTPTSDGYNATKLKYNGTALTSDEWTLSSPSNEVTLTASANARFKTIVVTYTSAGSGDEPSTPPTTYTIKWHTAVGTTTDVTLDEGAAITKPATDPTMSGYEFMGWTDQCSVAEDGTGFTALTDFGTADADKEFYAVFAVAETTGGGGGGTTTETLSGSNVTYSAKSGYVTFTATTASGTWSGKANYNTGGYLQINKNANNYHIGSPTFAGNVKSVKITTTNNSATNRTFYICSSNTTAQPTSGDLGSYKTTAANQTFTIDLTADAKQFYIYSSGAVYIGQIDVTFEGGGSTKTYSNYTTTCSGATVVETLTDTQFAWSAATAEATMGATNTFPTLTNTVPVSVTYESSNTAAATIAADGTITLVAPGTTNISAKFAGGEVSGTTYAAKTVTYALTVLKAPATPTSTVYVKVTSTAGITDGEYLIVYEDAASTPSAPVIFDGSLATLDAAGNMKSVTVSGNVINGDTEIDAATFTISTMTGGFAVKSKSGKYIGRTSSGNGINTGNSEILNTITITDGVVKIAGSGSGASTSLQYYSVSGQERFRYYGTTQKAIALYKKASSHTLTYGTCTNGSVSADVADGATVLSGTTITLTATPATDYKLSAYDVYKTDDATVKVTVTDGKFVMPEYDVTISATFVAAKTLTSIEITTAATQTTFWQGETFNYTGLEVTAHFDGAADEVVTPTVTGSTATAGTQTVTVSFTEGTTTKTATYTITVKAIPNKKETAYSVADAYDIIDKLTTAEGVFISGIISQVDSYNGTYNSITYWISADGTTTNQLQAYSGKGLEGANFSAVTDIAKGAQVIICGDLKKYGSTYEFDKNNYLADYIATTKQEAGITYAITEYTAKVNEAFSTPVLTNPNSLTVTYSSSDENLATIDAATGAVTILDKTGTVTITATFAGDESYLYGTASYNITISDPSITEATFVAATDLGNTTRGEGSIAKSPITFACSDGVLGNASEYRIYASSTTTFTAAEGYIITKVVLTSTASNTSSNGPAHLSTKEGSYTYNDKVGTWVGEAYTVTLSASAQVRATLITVYYKQDTRVAAGIAWSPATVSLTVGDAFTAPTFSNPNSVTGITFASDNTALATVTNAGAISLVSGKTGKATITATFAGDATYKPAEVTCKITVDHRSEDVVILAKCKDQYYALVAENLKSDVLKALPVEYVGGKIYNVETEDQASIIWKRVVVDGKTTFKNGDNYLSAVNSAALNLATEACEWVFEGDMYKIEGSTRTILYYTSTGGFKNYATTNMSKDGVNGEYSSAAITVDPIFADGDAYHRTVTEGDYGTLCIPFGSNVGNYSGAEFYEISWMEMDGTTPKGIWLDQVNGALTAGKPYIFKATASEIAIVGNGGTTASAPVAGEAGLRGTFTLIQDSETSGDALNKLEGNYMIAGNQFLLCGTGCWLKENRAYIDASIIAGHTTKKEEIPGRRRVCLGETSENTTTGVDNNQLPNANIQKVIENGQLIIIRDGVKYNVQGVRL